MFKRILLVTIWLMLLVVLTTGSFWALTEAFCVDQFLPGTKIGSQSVGGLTVTTVLNQLRDSVSSPAKASQTITYKGQMLAKVEPSVLGVQTDVEAAVWQAFGLGRAGNIFWQIADRAKLALGLMPPVNFYNVDEQQLSDWVLTKLSPQLPDPFANAKLVYKGNSLQVVPSKAGNRIDYAKFKQDLVNRLGSWRTQSPIELSVSYGDPIVSDADAEQLKQKIIENYYLPITLRTANREQPITAKELRQWQVITNSWNAITVSLDADKLSARLNQIKTLTDQTKQDATLVITNGAVKQFSPGVDGLQVDLEASAKLVQDNLLNPVRAIDLVVKTEPALGNLADNKYGIKELVARGVSDFSGSPANRRHNIAVGASKLNNVLIAPGATFSVNNQLGVIDGSTGYLPELVIKGDKTEPEFGGGLCQVATTVFRATLNAGVPIVERRNHSYRVAYYEPAGTDATIYPGSADLRFKNDTSAYLLMTNQIRGNELSFEFYGTKPNRKVVLEGPYIFNVTDYPEPIYIDTTDLLPGQEKKMDTAHKGADARLIRHIYDANGKEVTTNEFKSHYVPWPAKYLRGIDPTITNENPAPTEGTGLPA